MEIVIIIISQIMIQHFVWLSWWHCTKAYAMQIQRSIITQWYVKKQKLTWLKVLKRWCDTHTHTLSLFFQQQTSKLNPQMLLTTRYGFPYIQPVCINGLHFIQCTVFYPFGFQHFEFDELAKYSYSPRQQPVALAQPPPDLDSLKTAVTCRKSSTEGRREGDKGQ